MNSVMPLQLGLQLSHIHCNASLCIILVFVFTSPYYKTIEKARIFEFIFRYYFALSTLHPS